MSQHQAFKRVAVPPQVASKQEMITFPAPTRGLIMSENESYMQPGAAVVCDNWAPTMKGAKIRGGHDLWVDLHTGGDPYWANVILMMGFEGANLSTGAPGMTDESLSARGTGTVLGPKISTTNFFFGTSSLYTTADGSGAAYVQFPNSTDWNFGTAPFTFECFIRPDTIGGGGAPQYIFKGHNWNILFRGTQLEFNCTNGSTTVTLLDPINVSGTHQISYICVDFDGTKYRLYANAGNPSPVATTTMVASSTSVINILSSTTSVTIGSTGTTLGDGHYFGWIDELRITKGAARYHSDTGFAVPTAAFPRSGTSVREPIISAFQYVSGINHRMFFANSTKVYDVTTTTPVLVKGGQLDGNYSASQMANAAGDFLIAVNDAGDYPLRFDGTTWTTLSADEITGPPGSAVLHGKNLVHVCKYRNRWFFIEMNSMNAWYLGINSIGGALLQIPLSGAATKGGKLLYCATWSLDAGDGIDDKIVFGTDLGEIIVFTGSNPSDAANWRQEGRFDMSPPMGKNATLAIGGDLLVACVDGILPTSGAISKDRVELELAAVTRNIKPLWRENVLDKREWAWTMCKWDEYGGLFVTWPGGDPGKRLCAVANLATGAWTRYTGWDCTCFAKMRGDMFFGTQDGRIMQADRTGYDNGVPYVCTLVGGWEVFQSPAQTITWKQARASFSARASQPFEPLLSATTDYVVTLPTPPPAPVDPGALDLWDQGLWDQAQWDADSISKPTVRHTGWVSIGVTGFSHAPVIQVTVAQQVKPEVELISIAGTFERLATTV